VVVKINLGGEKKREVQGIWQTKEKRGLRLARGAQS